MGQLFDRCKKSKSYPHDLYSLLLGDLVVAELVELRFGYFLGVEGTPTFVREGYVVCLVLVKTSYTVVISAV